MRALYEQSLHDFAPEGLPPEADLIVVRAARNGDPEAFATLFRHYRPRLFAVARRYFAPGSDRDDVLQEATIGFFKAIRDFRRERGAFGPFAELCVRRQIVTFVKTATRQKHVALNRSISLDSPVFIDSQETLADRLAAQDTMEVTAEADIDNIEFLDALAGRCSNLERAILSLYAKGYSFDEMGREIGVSHKSIDNGVWRIKVKARKLLNKTQQQMRLS